MRTAICVCLLSSAQLVDASDRPVLRGTVRDRTTSEPLAAANVRILGTSRGTITNAEGLYTVQLDQGTHRLLFTMLGYRPDTVTVTLTAGLTRDVTMEPFAIVLPEIVVTSEDPAIEIIRRAIANKAQWIGRLKSYEMQAFTRQTIFRDTAVAAVNESYTKGYWQTGDTLREIIVQRRQTANIPSQMNVASVGRILNFSDDVIRFVGFTFVGPTAHNALDYYDYKLLRTRSSNGQEVYDISMIPRTMTLPLFSGTVNIAGGSYALIGVDVEPNAAFRVPFVKEIKLRYRQQFALYESTYWMPADIRIEGKFSIALMGFSIPRIGLRQTSVISDYAINIAIPDSLFRKPRLVVDSSAARYDSLYWAANPVLPLDAREVHAYATLDSTQKLDVQFRPGGVGMSLGGEIGAAAGLLSYSDFFFNRVEGLHLGAAATIERLTPHLSMTFGLAYGFSDKTTKYRFGATLYTAATRHLGIGGELYRRTAHTPDRGYFHPLFNSFTALFSRNDYRDYYRAEGGRVFVTAAPLPNLTTELSYLVEEDDAAVQTTEYSFFSRSRSYRPNPAATAGALHSVRFDLRLGSPPVPLDFIMQNSIEFTVEHSSPSFTGGVFDFTRYDALVSLSVPTFGQSFLLRPGFRIRASAGTSSGSLPAQRWFALETASGSFAPFGVMRAMEVKEFTGTGYVAMSIEHNFRSLPFLALDIPFLYENSIEFILHGGGGRLWSAGGDARTSATDGWYSEGGFSISRILDLFRADFTWRFTQPTAFRFTLGAAGLL